MEFFDWLEHSAFSMMMKENWVLYEMPLVLHAVGMAMMVGLSTALYMRVLGIASGVPLRPLEAYFKLMWAGFWINAISGVVLVILYPLNVVTNPVFYLKLVGVLGSVFYLRRIRRQVFGGAPESIESITPEARASAIGGLVVWLATITAGRLLAYKDIGSVEIDTAVATLVAIVVMFLAYLGFRRSRASEAG